MDSEEEMARSNRTFMELKLTNVYTLHSRL